jgi:hypothetical protein
MLVNLTNMAREPRPQGGEWEHEMRKHTERAS